MNFTHEKYGSGDIYLLLDFAAGIGIVLISAVVVVDVTLAVMAKLEALAFYVENFGVRQGFEMYKYLGVENLPNGVISWLQADMADGDSSGADLLDELANSGVKYNEDDVVMVMKNSDGKLMWLENGNSKVGLIHILERHADDFASQGVRDIIQLLKTVLSTEPIKTGTNVKGLFADYMFNGNSYRVAYGTNGFIVSFYPID